MDDQHNSELPSASDGFHEPDEDTRRRNVITALVILGVLTIWVVYGLRGPLANWLFG